MSMKQDLYNASLAYGQFQDFSSIIILVIVGTVALVGAYYVYKWQSNYVPTTGTVVSIDNPNSRCEASSDAKGNVTYSCLFTASYNYNGNSGTTQLQQSSSSPVRVGQKIGLVYNSADPTYPPTLPQVSSWILPIIVVIGLIFYLGAYYNYKLVTNVALRPVVATQGALALGTKVSNGIGNIIRGL